MREAGVVEPSGDVAVHAVVPAEAIYRTVAELKALQAEGMGKWWPTGPENQRTARA